MLLILSGKENKAEKGNLFMFVMFKVSCLLFVFILFTL